MTNDSRTELQVIVLAKRLVKHCNCLVDNPNRFPKKCRFSLVNTIKDDARGILRNLYRANYLHTADPHQMQQRLNYQLEAICLCDLLLQDIEEAFDEHCINENSCEYWARAVLDVKRMALSWRNSDLKKLSSL